MFDLDTNKQKVNLADDDVFQMVPNYLRLSSEPGVWKRETCFDLLYSNSM